MQSKDKRLDKLESLVPSQKEEYPHVKLILDQIDFTKHKCHEDLILEIQNARGDSGTKEILIQCVIEFEEEY